MEIQSQNLDAENIEQVEVLDLGTKDLNVFFKSDGAKITKFEKNETTEAGGTNTYKITFDDGDQVTMTIKNGQNGAKGDTGAQGPQGIQGEKGEQGQQGQKGADGANGADGFSPTASVTQTANGATISITDKNGTTQAAIANVTITPNADKSVTISNGTSSEKYLPQSEVAKCGIVSQTQKWSSDKMTYTMSNMQYGWIPKSFVDEFSSVGATFNETSGYFELNELTDISYKEAVNIYTLANENVWGVGTLSFRNARTNCIKVNGYYTASYYTDTASHLFRNSNYETIVTGDLNAKVWNQFSYTSYYIKKVIGTLIFTNATSATAFGGYSRLEYVHIKGLGFNFSIDNAKSLQAESIAYMINNSNSSKTITITLHADAYARAMADADVQSALAAHTNVTLVSA